MRQLLYATIVAIIMLFVTGAAALEPPACLPFDKIDNWRVYDRITLVVQSKGRDIGRVEVVESMAGANPLYLAHKIWFEARDDQLCGERDIVVADGRRMHIRQVIPYED